MRRSATKIPKRRIGKVSNDYSSYLAILVVDGAHASAYRGPVDDEDPKDDFVRACKATNRAFAVGKGTGIIAEIGGCGVAEVHRLGDTIVVPEHYSDEDDADAEAALDRVIAEHPTTNAKHLGTVEVKSGVLLLTGLLEKGPKLDAAKVKKAGVVKTKAGCAIAVKPGKYDVWREAFKKEPEGDWGSMPSRVRVVPFGTKVTKGEPIAKLGAAALAQSATQGTRRLLDPKSGWFAIQSLAVAKDGRLFAGELGRYGVAAWSSEGTLLWTKAVRKAPKPKPDYVQTVHVQLVGDELLAMFGYGTDLVVLDPKTGREKRASTIPRSREFQVVGDRIVLRTGIETTVLSYPALKPIAKHEEYVNRDGIAASRDGKWLAVFGDDLHVYDGKVTRHVRTIADVEPSAIAFTHDGLIVTGDESSRVRFFDPKSGKRIAQIDAAKERSRKPSINAIATSPRHVAVARDDGTVVLIDAKTTKVHELFEKHAVALPETGATSLDAIAFGDDGKTLWVGAGTKGEPVGATAYPLP